MRIDAKSIEHEKAIVWLEDVSEMPYVRETLDLCWSRVRKPRWNGRLVGYAVLGPQADSENPGMFYRRLFHLAPHDPYEGRGCPIEGVDPLTVEPGKPGEQNDKAFQEHKR